MTFRKDKGRWRQRQIKNSVRYTPARQPDLIINKFGEQPRMTFRKSPPRNCKTAAALVRLPRYCCFCIAMNHRSSKQLPRNAVERVLFSARIFISGAIICHAVSFLPYCRNENILILYTVQFNLEILREARIIDSTQRNKIDNDDRQHIGILKRAYFFYS